MATLFGSHRPDKKINRISRRTFLGSAAAAAQALINPGYRGDWGKVVG
ncbi:MAG: hypothetical protein ACYDA9_04665 [Terriglobia bacterium]